jgi:hypothetical protein
MHGILAPCIGMKVIGNQENGAVTNFRVALRLLPRRSRCDGVLERLHFRLDEKRRPCFPQSAAVWRRIERRRASTSVSHEDGHTDDANSSVFGFVSGNPGIDRVQRQIGSEDLSGTFVHDGIHSSILSL